MKSHPHPFSATRKGVPMGERADFKHCDRCGEVLDTPDHRAASEADCIVGIIEAIDGEEDPEPQS